MAKPTNIQTSPEIKTHPVVKVYIFVALGLILGTIAVFIYLFNGK